MAANREDRNPERGAKDDGPMSESGLAVNCEARGVYSKD